MRLLLSTLEEMIRINPPSPLSLSAQEVDSHCCLNASHLLWGGPPRRVHGFLDQPQGIQNVHRSEWQGG